MITGTAPSPCHGDSVSAAGGTPRVRLLVASSDTFPPQRVDVAVLFGEQLASRGHRIDWLLQSETACRRRRVAFWGCGKVWVAAADRGTSLLRRLHNHFLDLFNDARILPLMRSGQYDAVEVKDKFLAGLIALAAARLYRKRFLYWLSYPLPEYYLSRAREGTAPYPLLYRIRGFVCHLLLDRILLPSADHVFVQSEQMGRNLAAQGIPASRITAVPMGISLERIAGPLRAMQRRRIPQDEPSLLYLGSLGRERRIDFLLRVLARVRLEIPDARLYLVGQADRPEDQRFLLDELRRLELEEAVTFTGQVPQPTALEYVRDAAVCLSPIHPSPLLNAASPTKIVEYMAMGKPVVASSHPDQQNLVDASQCGYCVPHEEAAFADAAIALLRSPEGARSAGELGRRYILEHREYTRIADVVEREMLRVAGVLAS